MLMFLKLVCSLRGLLLCKRETSEAGACDMHSEFSKAQRTQEAAGFVQLAGAGELCCVLQSCCAYQVRESIEAAGRDARWEFSKAALFERTQHMAEVCACLAGMVDTVAGLYQFMGPQLKAVTGDPQVRPGHGAASHVTASPGSFHGQNRFHVPVHVKRSSSTRHNSLGKMHIQIEQGLE